MEPPVTLKARTYLEKMGVERRALHEFTWGWGLEATMWIQQVTAPVTWASADAGMLFPHPVWSPDTQ